MRLSFFSARDSSTHAVVMPLLLQCLIIFSAKINFEPWHELDGVFASCLVIFYLLVGVEQSLMLLNIVFLNNADSTSDRGLTGNSLSVITSLRDISFLNLFGLSGLQLL